jgi:putative peptidoglycan lipid II flippase
MVILSQVAGLVETNVIAIASGKAAGAFTLSQAWLIFMLPHSVITVSIVTAFYTRMSEHAAVSDISALRSDVSRAIRSSTLIIVIAAAAIIVAAVPIARVFTNDVSDAQQMAGVITAYLVGLVPFCIQFVVQRCFYALGDTRTPFAFTAFQVVVVIGLALLASLLPVGLIAVGIAAAVSIAGTAQLVVSAILLRRRIGDFGVGGIVASIGRYLLGAAVAAVAGYFVLSALGGFDGGFAVTGQLPAIISVAATGAAMLAIYAAILAILRSPELQTAASPILSRFRRS